MLFFDMLRHARSHSVHKSDIIHYVPRSYGLPDTPNPYYFQYGLSRIRIIEEHYHFVSLLCQVSRLDNVWKRRRTRITRYRETSKATDLKFAHRCMWTISPKRTNKNRQKGRSLGHVTLINFGTPSNISPKRIEPQTRNLAQGCIRTISRKLTNKNSVKGRGVGHVTPIKFGKTSNVSPNVYSYRLEIWHTNAYGQFIQNARL